MIFHSICASNKNSYFWYDFMSVTHWVYNIHRYKRYQTLWSFCNIKNKQKLRLNVIDLFSINSVCLNNNIVWRIKWNTLLSFVLIHIVYAIRIAAIVAILIFLYGWISFEVISTNSTKLHTNNQNHLKWKMTHFKI